MNIPDTVLCGLLDAWPVAHLASLTPNGRPHVVPIVFCRDDAALYSPIDGKTKQGRALQREANIIANSAVSVLLDDYRTDWAALWWVRLDGDATLYRPDQDHAGRLRAMLQAKYPQYRQRGMLPAQPAYLRITWQRASGWAQTDLHAALDRAISARRTD